jgi:glycosyltransferase involved in cell wall biosynthesis
MSGMLVRGLSEINALVRRWMPAAARAQLGLWAGPFLRAADRLHAATCAPPPSLAGLSSFLPPEAFSGGPILLVSYSLGPGGSERQVVNLLLGLQRRGLGHRSGLLCLRLDSSRDRGFFRPQLAGFDGLVRNAGSLATAKEALGPEAVDRLRRHLAWLPPIARMNAIRLASEFATLRPAVVHAWQDATNIEAGFSAAIVGVPRIIVSGRNLNPTNFGFHRVYMREGYRQLANLERVALVNNSEAGAADYARWLALDPSCFVVKRNGLDSRAMMRRPPEAIAALRAQLGIPLDAPVIGSVFRLVEEKRPLLFIETFAYVLNAIPNCHAVVFGSGPMERKMRRLAARLGVGNRLHLRGPSTDIALACSVLDVFLLTSRVEGTPNTVLEASLVGVPVVATAVGGVPETMRPDATGFLVAESTSQSEPHELATALGARVVQVLRDEVWRQTVLTTGPEFVRERYGLDRMIDESLDLYQLRGRP